VKTQIINTTPTSFIHLCGDGEVTDSTHGNKQRANREDIKRKMQLAADNQATLKLHIEKTKHLKVLHTFAQIKEELIMEPRSIVLTLRVSPEVNAWLEAMSRETHRPKSNYIYALLLQAMKGEQA